MRVMRFVNSLYVWIALSIIIHVAVLRWIRFEKLGVDDNLIKYEVRLLYYKPFIEEPRVVQKREEQKVLKEERKEVVVEKTIEKEEVFQEVISEKPVEKEDILYEVLKKDEETHQRIVRVPEIVEKEAIEKIHEFTDTIEEEPAPAGVPPAERSSMEDLSIVLDRLREKILENKIYPAAARKKGLQGVVFLRLELDSEGNIIALQVMRSSGHKILDRAAISLLKKVVPYEHGIGRSIAVEIPIKYSLVE